LEFDAHAVIFAEGAPAESFVDDESREMFDNAAEFRRRYPSAVRTSARFCAPRVEDGWELQDVRRRLAERAAVARRRLYQAEA
jgi:O-antigen biosynthesis protein